MKGIIYSINCINNNLIYIGSTKELLCKRKAKHIYDSKYPTRIKPVHKTILDNGGFDNFYFKILKEVDINTDATLLRVYEKKIIDDYKHNNDYVLMNTYS